ncbi:MAG: tetratricopeptide repeat protein [Kineosporiaceae bacterium]
MTATVATPAPTPTSVPSSGAPTPPGGGLRLRVSADRRLRGPFTAASQVLTVLVPIALRRDPALVRAHDIEIRAVCPDLRPLVPGTRETLTSSASPSGRTRFYPRARVTRLAHGVTEFVLACVAAGDLAELVVTGAGAADATDVEWLTVLRRRSEGRPLALTVAAADVDAAAVLLQAATDGAQAPAAWHDGRAQALLRRADAGEEGLRLGAIPYHLERGGDPAGAGVAALQHAIEHCVLEGFYEAVIDLGERLMPLLDWDERTEEAWLVTAKVTTALTGLDRAEEAREWFLRAQAATTDPGVHLQSAYGLAMIDTRFAKQRDHHRAKAAVNTAIAIARVLPDEQRRAFNTTFSENGLALVEMHRGDLHEALRLVTEGMARLDADVSPDQHTQHRSVLAYNRAQLLAGLGRLEEALTAYGEVIAEDPNHSEYYLERASLWRRAGQPQLALDDYAMAIRLSPPYPEPHYNRAELLAGLGEPDLAAEGFASVLELDPEFPGARVNLVSALLEAGRHEAATTALGPLAHAEPAAVLAAPDGTMLLTLRAQLAHAAGQDAEARADLDALLAADPDCVVALATRALLAFSEQTPDAVASAVADLRRAVALDDDETLRDNLAVALAWRPGDAQDGGGQRAE